MVVGAKYRVRPVPLHLREANEFVARHHRHNLPTVGGKFALGVADDEGTLVGVAVARRPVARRLDDGKTLEVLRVCTDGTPNACSFLYARCAKVARLMGYERVITYTLESEGGASLKRLGPRRPARWRATSGATRTAPAGASPSTTSRSTAGNCDRCRQESETVWPQIGQDCFLWSLRQDSKTAVHFGHKKGGQTTIGSDRTGSSG